jgi:metal-responsive CopG/Arc/MetJ family transcriptional regulator
MQRRRQEWVTVKLPKALADEFDKWVEEHAELGLKSRSDAVSFAIRELLRKENTNPYERF